jgi:hypothetical protein
MTDEQFKSLVRQLRSIQMGIQCRLVADDTILLALDHRMVCTACGLIGPICDPIGHPPSKITRRNITKCLPTLASPIQIQFSPSSVREQTADIAGAVQRERNPVVIEMRIEARRSLEGPDIEFVRIFERNFDLVRDHLSHPPAALKHSGAPRAGKTGIVLILLGF